MQEKEVVIVTSCKGEKKVTEAGSSMAQGEQVQLNFEEEEIQDKVQHEASFVESYILEVVEIVPGAEEENIITEEAGEDLIIDENTFLEEYAYDVECVGAPNLLHLISIKPIQKQKESKKIE